jgi:hypothetical protein
MVDDRKSSTMNSMFIGSVLSKPNVDSIINAVATILHSQMLEVIILSYEMIFKLYIGLNIRSVDTLRQWLILLLWRKIYSWKTRSFW